MSRRPTMELLTLACLSLALCTDSVPAKTGIVEPRVVQVESTQPSGKSANHSIYIAGDNFMVDGVPLRIVSGSLHYFRLPAEYWRDRLRKLKAAGLNSVATYVEWSYHEPEERQYSFEGDRDIAAFVRIAAEEGLHVLLRPGPYICAERDLGGLPYWLLGKYPNIRLRSTDKDFIEETRIWMAMLFQQLTPFLFGNGGPIILVQVENEYGSYGSDKAYMAQVRDILMVHVGTNAILYTTDGLWPQYFLAGQVPGALTTIDFGPGSDVSSAFKTLRQYMPEGPLMNSEYYPGWLTHWREDLQQVNTEDVVRKMRNMLDQHINFNFYMFFGGTNFEYTSGANYGSFYQPDITSYDYDAPLNEAGDPTHKYYAIRNALKEYNLVASDIPEPLPSAKGAYGPVTVTAQEVLLSNQGRQSLGKKYHDVNGTTLPCFEELRQRGGLVLYEMKMNEGNGTLSIKKPRDWIYVYIDEELKGALNRMYKKYDLAIETRNGSVLSLLVENQGRINYGSRIHDRKGILSAVTYNGNPLNGKWSITGYPLEVLNKSNNIIMGTPDLKSGPVLFEGKIILPQGKQPLDTFLDTTGWGRGYVWVNGYNLGRYWPGLGPQITLYVPGVWLKAAPAENVVQILELESSSSNLSMEFIDYPILNRTTHFSG